jgi:hypothetical protein
MDFKIQLSGKRVSMGRHVFSDQFGGAAAKREILIKFAEFPVALSQSSSLSPPLLHLFVFSASTFVTLAVFSTFPFPDTCLLPAMFKFKLSFNIFGFINGQFEYEAPILPGTTLAIEMALAYPPAGAIINLFGLGGRIE